MTPSEWPSRRAAQVSDEKRPKRAAALRNHVLLQCAIYAAAHNKASSKRISLCMAAMPRQDEAAMGAREAFETPAPAGHGHERTVNLSHLACMFPTQAAIGSNYRRLQRFFEQVILDGSQLARVIVRIAGLGSGPWLLALDRTCWKFGRHDVNVLMLAIIRNGIAIPVMWDVLGRAGTSTTAQRSALLSRSRRLWRGRHRRIDRRSGVHRHGLDGVPG